MIDHSEILPRLAAYYDGALPEDECAAVRQHLDICAECRTRLAEWTALDSSLRLLTVPEPVDVGVAADVLLKIASDAPPERTQDSHRPLAGRWQVWVGAAAAVFVLAVSAAIWRAGTQSTGSTPDLAQAPVRGDEHGVDSPGVHPPAESPEARNERSVEATREDETSSALKSESASREQDEPVAAGRTAVLSQDQDVKTKATAAAPRPIRSEDSGIPQGLDGPARPAFLVDIHYRFYDRIDASFVELNVVPVFEIAFTPVGYARRDALSDRWDVSNPEPMLLSPEETYLVSNLRVERSTLLAMVTNQAPTSDMRIRLAEVTWRLANITADQDDVRSAISAQSEVLRQSSEVGTQSRARLAYLRGLVR
jgi:hypothetical protein